MLYTCVCSYVDTDTEVLNQLCDQISEELDAEPRPQVRPSTWHSRMEKREESWEGTRNVIFEHVLANEDLPDSNVRMIVFINIVFQLIRTKSSCSCVPLLIYGLN